MAQQVTQPASAYASSGQLAFSSDGSRMYLGYTGVGLVAVVATDSLATVATIPCPSPLARS